MAIALVSVPTPSHLHFNQRSCLIIRTKPCPWLPKKYCCTTFSAYPSGLPLYLCSSSSTTVVEDAPSPPPDYDTLPPQTESTDEEEFISIPQGGCKACGREEIEKGCNGKGRIQGGIATIPGFGWWPIKAYRPCPGFVASGGRYRRHGQTMDEVAFGRGERGTSGGTGTGVQSSEKKQSPRRFKK